MSFRVSAWAIRNPIPVVTLFLALTLAGLVAYLQLPIKQFPNIAFPIVTVTVTQSGAAPSEVEDQITRPIDNALTGIAGVQHVPSTITLGTYSTVIEFQLHTDKKRATDELRTPSEQTG